MYKDIGAPEKYKFFLARKCSCNKTWKTIGIEDNAKAGEVIRQFRQTKPIEKESIPDKQLVTLYSRR